MTQNTTKLKLPPPAKAGVKNKILLIIIFIVLCAGATYYGLWRFKTSHTPSASIEGNIISLAPKLSGIVTEVLVEKDQAVQAGQLLVRLASAAHNLQTAEARAQVAAIRQMLPEQSAGMEDFAKRLESAQAAEQDIVQRIVQARGLENAAALDVQRKAEAHARAQLEVRRLDLLSSKYSVPRSQTDRARNDEAQAQGQLARARVAYEEQSRNRAAVEGELQRIRSELEQARRLQMRGSGHAATTGPDTQRGAALSELYALNAPEAGRILEIFAQTGAQAQAGQALVTLVPEGGAFYVTAWFGSAESQLVKKGQHCRIFVVELPGKVFYGQVENVLPQASLPPRVLLSGIRAEDHVPVRIQLATANNAELALLRPGMRAAAEVHSFPLFWNYAAKYLAGSK